MLWLFIFACVAVEIVSKDKDLLNNPDTGAIVERLGVLEVQLIGSNCIHYPLREMVSIDKVSFLILFFDLGVVWILESRSAMSRNTPHRLWQSFDPLLTSQWLDPTPKIAVKHSQTKRLRPGVLHVPNDGSIHGNSFVQSCAVLLAWAKERGILFFQHFMSCYRYAFGSLPRAILTLVQFVSLDSIAGSSGFQRNGWNVMGKLVQLRSNSPGFPDIATAGFDLLWTAHSLEWKHPSSWCIIYLIVYSPLFTHPSLAVCHCLSSCLTVPVFVSHLVNPTVEIILTTNQSMNLSIREWVLSSFLFQSSPHLPNIDRGYLLMLSSCAANGVQLDTYRDEPVVSGMYYFLTLCSGTSLFERDYFYDRNSELQMSSLTPRIENSRREQ